MDGYTISRFATAAGVSVHVVRDYVLRGLVQPAQRTPHIAAPDGGMAKAAVAATSARSAPL